MWKGVILHCCIVALDENNTNVSWELHSSFFRAFGCISWSSSSECSWRVEWKLLNKLNGDAQKKQLCFASVNCLSHLCTQHMQHLYICLFKMLRSCMFWKWTTPKLLILWRLQEEDLSKRMMSHDVQRLVIPTSCFGETVRMRMSARRDSD